MSEHNRLKKDGVRKDKKVRARRHDFEQPIVGSATRQPARDTSNLTDQEIAGPDWKSKLRHGS